VAIESDLATFLTSNSTAPLVYGLITTNMYPYAANEDVDFPVVVYERLDTDRSEGYSNDGYNGTSFARIQYTCWSDTYATAVAISNAIRYTLCNLFNRQIGYAHVFMVSFETERDVYYPPAHGQDIGYLGRELQLSVRYIESIEEPSSCSSECAYLDLYELENKSDWLR
jgi:hypothetical protein